MKKKETYNECKSGIVLDEIEFFNAGTYTDPYPGVKIKGREEEDYKTECEIRLFGTEAEDFRMRMDKELDEIVDLK